VLNGDHPLFHMPNVVCTPHLGYAVHEMYERSYGAAIDNILAYASGKPVNVYNTEALAKR
jgi:D-3-phosphoglycerate dehydrogenase